MRAVNETEWQEYLERYRSNDWACEPPPVCTARWTTQDWIAWIFGVEPENDRRWT